MDRPRALAIGDKIVIRNWNTWLLLGVNKITKRRVYVDLLLSSRANPLSVRLASGTDRHGGTWINKYHEFRVVKDEAGFREVQKAEAAYQARSRELEKRIREMRDSNLQQYEDECLSIAGYEKVTTAGT